MSMYIGETSSASGAWRTPFYSKLKQLNTDIHTFQQCVRVIVPKHMQKEKKRVYSNPRTIEGNADDVDEKTL